MCRRRQTIRFVFLRWRRGEQRLEGGKKKQKATSVDGVFVDDDDDGRGWGGGREGEKTKI